MFLLLSRRQKSSALATHQWGPCGWAPDLPGCVAAGATLDETRRLMREAIIRLHIESLREHGEPVPEPATLVEYAETVS